MGGVAEKRQSELRFITHEKGRQTDRQTETNAERKETDRQTLRQRDGKTETESRVQIHAFCRHRHIGF